jgi:hypothetical protein
MRLLVGLRQRVSPKLCEARSLCSFLSMNMSSLLTVLYSLATDVVQLPSYINTAGCGRVGCARLSS